MKNDKNPYHNQGMHKGAPPSSFIKAKILRQNMTEAEKRLWQFLKNKQLQDYKFRRQHPIHIYIVDFYCHELRLIIEIDGEYHNRADQISKDIERSELLKLQGLHIIRFSNKEVINSIGKVLTDLEKYISGISPKPKES
ncbi:endonuclease domain-containing protein [Aequorivita viscosa]|uniref:Very-short-patch-repair endonuclease n=1 Tax=Aequorivita viscosa TaxID=797419 RepID=A0A1M6LL92_9FLAO|nr:endonuclease domain-containing protein [Aequorivita viscosa]SDV99359.1 ATP-dependent helicase HrpA [Aequorivita viscosa]SHJ71949.1 Very-short-patch-repair endonuclease [Aequorivita viscosa]